MPGIRAFGSLLLLLLCNFSTKYIGRHPLIFYSPALDAMDKLKAKIKSLLGDKKSKTTEKPAPTTTNGASAVPKPTPTDTAAAPSTAEPTTTTGPPAAAGMNRLRRLSDKTTLVDIFSGAPVAAESKAPEPAAPAPGATPAAEPQKDEAKAVAAA
jgi:hypothetical protein